jgi:hypothetical protein
MIKYQAPDGTMLFSKPGNTVSYVCNAGENCPEGTFVSYETTSAATAIGIQQIKIVRTVVDGQMTIEITESTDQELLDYIESNKSN